MLSKIDLYFDLTTLVAIYQCAYVYEYDRNLDILFWAALFFLVLSVTFQALCIAKMILRLQPQSTYNPVFTNTACVCHCVNLQSLSRFIDKFSVEYFGYFNIKWLNAVKAIAAMKMVIENIFQFIIQLLFLGLTQGNNVIQITLLVVSVALSIVG